MVDRTTISPGELAQMSGKLAQMKEQAARDWHGTPSVYQPEKGRVVFDGNGGQHYENVTVNRVNVAIPNPKTVFVNGMETSREAAELMGWVPDGEQSFPEGVAANQAAQSGVQETEQQQTAEDAAWKQTEDATNAALNRLYDARGAEAAAVLEATVESGDIDAVLAQGFAANDVNAVVSGLTAYANREMQAAGVNVAMASAVLNDAQLSEMRRTVINQDGSKLRSIAEGVKGMLADMPVRDPAGFQRFFAQHFSDIASERGEDGTVLVSVEGVGMVPWSNAVRLGAVYIK